MTAAVWVRAIVLLAAFAALFGLLASARFRGHANAEARRKMLHVGGGVFSLALPFTFDTIVPAFVVTSAAALLMSAIRFSAPLRERLGHVAYGVERRSWGELYFPCAIAFLFWAAHGGDRLLFVVPVLTLTFADTAGALVGGRVGRFRYVGSDKTLAGSIAFAAVAFLSAYVPIVVDTDLTPVTAVSVAWIFAVGTAIVEACCRRGSDNLLVPAAGYVLLSACLTVQPSTLASQSLMTATLGGLLCLQTWWCSGPAKAIR